ncbi:hypothetical protein SCLCIDRAFT_140278, partial [Scleroderma citrinum Foug A]
LRKLAYKIVNSSTVALPAWKEILKDLRMTVKLMPRDVATRWNSTLDLLEYALKHRKAIDLVMQWRELGLRELELTDEEWVIVLKDATLYFSCSTPNLAMVIPAMDHIDHVLSEYSRNKKFLPSIRSGISIAHETLNCYYSRTDQSEVYRIAMSK